MVSTRVAQIDGFGRALLVLTGLVCLASPWFGGAAITFGGSEFLVGLFALMLCVAYVYGPARRNVLGFSFTAALVADLIAYGLVFGLASYVAAQSSMPLFDATFARIDAALGFDWPSYLAALNASPLRGLTKFGYYSMLPQLAVLVLVLALCGERDQVRLVMNAVLICAVLAIALSAVFPALPAYHHFGLLTAQTPASAIPFPAYEPFVEMTRIRSGGMTEFNIINTTGIIAFPSFHTMVAVLLIAFSWGVAWLRVPFLILNLSLIAATPVDGGHFLCDVIAGAGLAILVISSLRSYAAQTGASPGIVAVPTAS